jgi:type III secretion protein J
MIWRFFSCLILVLGLSACSQHIELVSNLPEADGNEVLVALLNAGLNADKTQGKDGVVSVWVEEKRLARAIDILKEQGLPRPRYLRMGDVFKKENLISSPLEERARYLYALSQEIERTLGYIDGVVTARVHVVMPEKFAPGEKIMPSSAAVFIKYQQGFGVELLIPQVKGILTSSIAGLENDKVSVALVPSKLRSANAGSQWADVLFFRVEAASATPLRIALGVLFLLTILGVGGLWIALAKGGARASRPGTQDVDNDIAEP